MTRTTRHLALAGALLAVAGTFTACATTQKKPASLVEAETIYNRLSTMGTSERAEADLIRAREAIAEANRGLSESKNTEYANALGTIALRAAQTAEATSARAMAMNATDSLTKERLRRQTEVVAAENAALRQRTDSLRRVNAEANARLDSALMRLRTLVTEITSLQETTRGIVINLSDILFDVNKATLKPGAANNVRRIAAILQQYPDKQISVEGHTDATGSDAYNQKLSEDRAAAVRNELIAGGVSASVITSKGFGKTQPVATNDTPAGRQQTRRVEVVVLGAGTIADAHEAAVRDSAARQQTPPR
jgi:outer membrane protein OmpA-like peptidoglycan-associated protein